MKKEPEIPLPVLPMFKSSQFLKSKYSHQFSQFLKFATKAFPEMIFDQINSPVSQSIKAEENSKTARSINVSPQGKKTVFPSIGKLSRFHANSLHQ